MQSRPHLWLLSPVAAIAMILIAALWPHGTHSLLVSLPQRMVWASLLVLLVVIPIGSVVFPHGRAVYVFAASLVVLIVSLGLAAAFHGGLSPGLALSRSNHYRWLAVFELLSLLLAWVSVASLTRYLTHGRALAVRLLAVGGLYLFAIMVLGACLAPLEKLFLLTFSYGTSLFNYAIGNHHGLVFAGGTYRLTIGVSLGTATAAWCAIAILTWTKGHVHRLRVGRKSPSR